MSKKSKKITTRKIVLAGILGAISILLGVTKLGYIPVPTAAGNATIMHIPVIIGSVLEGWGVGTVIGAIFGVSAFIESTTPIFKDPIVSIIPRLFIGIFAYLTYAGLKRFNEYVAIGAAGIIGSLTNTVLVLAAAVIRGYFSIGVAATVAVTSGIPEAIVSLIITLAVVAAWKNLSPRRGSKSKLEKEITKGESVK